MTLRRTRKFSLEFATLLLITAATPLLGAVARAEEAPQRINVENLKEKYWAKGDENEMRVVQHRLYSKSGKFELSAFAGWVSNDPFLNIHAYGGRVGYFINEYFGINVLAMKYNVTNSSAFDRLLQVGATANTNEPSSFYGAEATWSPLYGKLSLVGRAIIYLDIHLTGGIGLTKTETGTNPTPNLGIGQQIYINKYLALALDYKLQFYSETVPQKSPPYGTAGTRSVTTSQVLLGLTALVDVL